MRLAFDTETELAERGGFPRLTCMSLQAPGKAAQLFGVRSAPSMIRSYLDDPKMTAIVGHNVAFDLAGFCVEDEAFIPLVFGAYVRGVVRDTGVRQKLLDIRKGRAVDGKRARLAELAKAYLKQELDKGEDSYRYWYGLLRDVSLDEWPAAAKAYALTDASVTLAVFDRQQDLDFIEADPAHPDTTISPDEVLQTRAAWCLYLMRLWGFRTDARAVAELKANLEVRCAEAQEQLLKFGLYKWKGTIANPRRDGVAKDMAAIKARVTAACEARDVPVPLTETGLVCTDRETLLACGDQELELLAKSGVDFKMLSTSVPRLEEGATRPIQPQWNELVRTGRTSCGAEDDPGNWQNPNRKGGVRECVVPRPGYLFGSADYAQLELCTLAQTWLSWFGASEMAKALQAGRDLHLDLACSTASLLGAPHDDHPAYAYERALAEKSDPYVKRQRQFAKVANFGFPGGLGADTFISYARGYDLTTTRTEAVALKAAWLKRWPEAKEYFARIARMVDRGEMIRQTSGRGRGDCDFCAACNTMFQGAAADGAKEAMWRIAQACYVDRKSPLFDSRIILFLHDEFIIECPTERAAEATDEMARIMIEAMQVHTPDIPISVEPNLMNRWWKEAAPVRDANGRLMVWEPKEKR